MQALIDVFIPCTKINVLILRKTKQNQKLRIMNASVTAVRMPKNVALAKRTSQGYSDLPPIKRKNTNQIAFINMWITNLNIFKCGFILKINNLLGIRTWWIRLLWPFHRSISIALERLPTYIIFNGRSPEKLELSNIKDWKLDMTWAPFLLELHFPILHSGLNAA